MWLPPLHYKDIYGIRPGERELQNTVVWVSCGFDRPPSRDAVDGFLTDLEHVVDEVCDRLVWTDDDFHQKEDRPEERYPGVSARWADLVNAAYSQVSESATLTVSSFDRSPDTW